MDIVRTEVIHAITASGHRAIKVVFCGHDDECVTVDMASVGAETDDAAIGRARAMLLRTATIDLAMNEYDQRSNGNFDELSLTAAHAEQGDIYIFEYRDGGSSRQIPPSRMPNLEAARKEAIRCAIDLLVDLEPGVDDLSGWLVQVRNQQGELLFTIDVQEADAARQAQQ